MNREENMTLSLIQHMINKILLIRDEKTTDFRQLELLVGLLDFTITFKQKFEDEYLNISTHYYKSELLQAIENFEIQTFLMFIEKRFQQENELSLKLKLSKKCSTNLIKILEEEFIAKNTKKMLENGFVSLIESNNFENLGKIFTAFKRIGKTDVLRLEFNDYIKKKGNEIMFSKTDDLIDNLISFRKAMRMIVQNSFEGTLNMKTTIDYAFQFFINLKTNMMGELTSKVMDDCLRRNKNMTDEETLRKKLDDVFEIFRYLSAKDIFSAFYTKRLMKRLILNSVYSNDLESHILNKLRTGLEILFF